MDKITFEKIYKLINKKLKQKFGDDIEKVYIDIDEKNKIVNVMVITKEFNPELETKIFEFENQLEKRSKINSEFKVVSSLAYA